MNNERQYYPSLKEAVILILLLPLYQILAVFIAKVALVALHADDQTLLGSLIANLIQYFPYLLVYSFAQKRWLSTGQTSIRSDSFKIDVVLIGAIITISISILALPVISLIPMPAFFMKLLQEIEKEPALPIIIVTAAPVFEELLFRSVILDGFSRRYPATKALIYSALLFGISHFNPWQGINAFFIGLLLGWVYLRTRSLITCIFIHAIHNGFNIAIDIEKFYKTVPAGLLISMACVIIYLGCWWLEKRMRKAQIIPGNIVAESDNYDGNKLN